MSYFWLVFGLVGCIIGVLIHPMANKRIRNDEVNHLTVKGYVLSYVLVISGIVLIVRELIKVF